MLAQLSIFARGFDLGLAESIVDAGDGSVWVGDLVQSLVAKSWIRSIENERFDLLVSVHDYAGEQLAQMQTASGAPAAEAAATRHWRTTREARRRRGRRRQMHEPRQLGRCTPASGGGGGSSAPAGCCAPRLGGAGHDWAFSARTRTRGESARDGRAGLLGARDRGMGHRKRSALAGRPAEARTHLDSGILDARKAADTRCEALLRHQHSERRRQARLRQHAPS